ncbi:hypothetical protein AWJ20_3710 [Sugiyamaella lignohabitans]|uniref:Sterol regulatory element-binding protein cleavage-activating protein n=1 Tax=Sugiyamaella lignohabitans TaxID=796027 RepID=A0A167BWH9_9ASCO|nr:uncharacterized protein AWJ20_3710 [Sugiyamaella lignohabitans]ANB10916.1 hypothetical protein AWJ20_3710 [Sugiyamaella lignohabitans]
MGEEHGFKNGIDSQTDQPAYSPVEEGAYARPDGSRPGSRNRTEDSTDGDVDSVPDSPSQALADFHDEWSISDPLLIKQAVIFPPSFFNPLRARNHDTEWDKKIAQLRSLLTNDSSLLTSNNRNDSALDHVQLPYAHFIPSPQQSDISQYAVNSQVAQSLLLSPKIKENRFQYSRGLLISYLSRDKRSSTWSDAITTVCCESPSLGTLQPTSKTHDNPINVIPNFPRAFLPPLFIYSAFAIYKDVVFTDTRCVRSRTGLVIAQVVQIMLSVFSAATITSVFFPQFCFSALYSFSALPAIIIMGSIENTLTLINSVSGTRPEISPTSRVAIAAQQAFPKTVKAKLITAFLLSLVIMANLDKVINSIFLFSTLSVLIDLALHVTYFTAVLSVDIRRLELAEVLLNPLDDEEPIVKHDSGTSSIPFFRQYQQLKGFRLRTFLYLNYLNPRQRYPIVMASIVVIHMWLSLAGPLKDTATLQISSHFLDRTILFMNDLLNVHNYTVNIGSDVVPLVIYNPIVLSFDDNSNCFHFSPFLSTTSSIIGGYSLFILFEFVLSLAIILLAAALILKLLLPKRDCAEEDRAGLHSDSENKFSSKDLAGYHTLDVIQIVVNKSWIATVSLDHGICVWNVCDGKRSGSKQDCKFRTLPPRLWPVSRVLVGLNSMLVIISAHNHVIEAWDFKNNKILYSIKDDELFPANSLLLLSFIVADQVVIITRSGAFVTISRTGTKETICPDLTFGRDVELIAATLLVTPKINDKVVCLFSDNSIVVVTHVAGTQWSFRSLDLLESLTAVSERRRGSKDTVFYRPYPAYPPIEIAEASSPSFLVASNMNRASIPCTRPMEMKEKAHSVVSVPAIHMVLVVSELKASLFDVHTGVIVRHFQLGLYKPDTIRVFHAQPTHCRFCGCASIESISVAYYDQEDKGLVICHTVQIENRAKNNICLRVERDPRETRCLGFEAATEQVHWIDRVEGWDTTDINMMMGVRRKENPQSSGSPSPDSGRRSPATGTERRDLSMSATTSVLRRISNKLSQGASSTSSASYSTPQPPTHGQKKPPLNITWEGWAMTGKGKVSYYNIPDVPGKPGSYNIQNLSRDDYIPQASSRLLIRTVGPAVKYGKKSIAVAFGNVIKIMYFGNEEFHDEIIYGNRLVGIPSYESAPPSNTPSASRRWKREIAY